MNDFEGIVINDKLTIPLSELKFRFSTSSGPGGQHANRSATKVTLLFDVTSSPNLDEATRQRLLSQLSSYLDKNGMMQIQVQDSRSQHQNREIALLRFQTLLANALKIRKKRRRTRPSRQAIEKRLANKKIQSRRKQERRQKWS